jgi:hypothetical protein
MRRPATRKRRTELSPATVAQIAVMLVLIGFMIHAARSLPRDARVTPALYEGESAASTRDARVRPLPEWVREMLEDGALNPEFFQNPASGRPSNGRRIDYYFYPEDPRELNDIMVVACDKPGTYADGGNLLFRDGSIVFWRPEGGQEEYAELARAVLEGNRRLLAQKAVRIRAELEKASGE